MFKQITAFLLFPSGNFQTLEKTFRLLNPDLVEKSFAFITRGKNDAGGITAIETDYLSGSSTVKIINEKVNTPYILFMSGGIEPGQFCLERFLSVAQSSEAGLLYSDHYEIKNGTRREHPQIDCQSGSIRDDFYFGPLLMINTEALNDYCSKNDLHYKYAGLYDLRLFISRTYPLVHIPEYLYTVVETDNRTSGEKNFDYVDPKNAEVQLEMEKAATEHLKKIGAFLPPCFEEPKEVHAQFKLKASIIIPVKNRKKTIADALNSALMQKTGFPFNVIVTDNHSEDGTTEVLRELSASDNRIIHLIPERTDLSIGGCWNEAVHNIHCGKYVVQLDSDDLYSDENTLRKIIEVFDKENCAMVIGSYKLTDFALNEIPPGIIDHREWTDENGRNNALRVNGLGAPRAFYTPVLRNIKMPNVSYGEDYAVCLAVSRHYKIARIFEPLYLCRRWEGNSDASLPVEKQNMNNFYKDRIRTLEILARQKINASRNE